jgi:transcriptional regulator with XRE-family HTH domain
MLTPFGKTLRKERLERGMMLGEMARKLKVGSSYLSQVETGKKPLSDSFVSKVADFFDLNTSERNALFRDAAASRALSKATSFNIKVPESASTFDRELAARLELGFARMPPAAKQKLDELLKESFNG